MNESIVINGEEYVKKVILETEFPYVIVRTYSAGVFAGYLKERNGREAVLLNARRLWQFFSASLSELAQSGTPDVSKCKFPEEVSQIEVLEVIEILSVTKKAKASIASVPVWKA